MSVSGTRERSGAALIGAEATTLRAMQVVAASVPLLEGVPVRLLSGRTLRSTPPLRYTP